MCKVSLVSFAVAADAYDRFMGRYSRLLAPAFADFAGIAPGQRVLDVGCGPGALTTELVRRVGADSVAAVDPSESFVAAARERHPGADVRHSAAEELPFADDEFDAALAQLVVHFMSDPVAGLRELARVARSGGVVAACVWDHAGGRSPLTPFWDAARRLAGDEADDEASMPGTREGHLAELFEQAGIAAVEPGTLTVSIEHPSFEDWWEPFTEGVGPAGAYVAKLDPEGQARLREQCRELLAAQPFVLEATVWAVRGRA
jgi:SAM-dependent methyltransferase